MHLGARGYDKKSKRQPAGSPRTLRQIFCERHIRLWERYQGSVLANSSRLHIGEPHSGGTAGQPCVVIGFRPVGLAPRESNFTGSQFRLHRAACRIGLFPQFAQARPLSARRRVVFIARRQPAWSAPSRARQYLELTVPDYRPSPHGSRVERRETRSPRRP